MWYKKDLLGIKELSQKEILTILDVAKNFKEVAARPIKKVPTLRGKTVINLFFEPSTRTRISFEIAAKRLSADSLNFSSSSSSLVKGETIIDTALTLEAMAPDIVIVRHSKVGIPHKLASILKSSVVNAGDGAHEHPTQALLDAFTILEHKGKIEGLSVAIIGDISHSRVVRSNIHLLTKLGAKVRVAGPLTLIPPGFEKLGVKICKSIQSAVEGCDVIMALRIQKERQGRVFIPSLEEYYEMFALTPQTLKYAKEDAIVMHPGPINRGVEISSEIADSPRSVILDQVSAGVAVRMAILYLLANVKEKQDG